ncbi:MAG: hypothetical protein NC417_04040 [Candidatus Gastranaerophilales bacterium]|nr:hypothetical protein [Candidatus Gastranaerophilales bacterium]
MKPDFLKTKPKPLLCLRAVQAFVILMSLVIWALMKGDAYQASFSAEDLILLSPDAVATDIISIDGASGTEGVFLRTPEEALSKGTYQIIVNYSAKSTGNMLSVSSAYLDPAFPAINELELDPECHILTAKIDIPRDVADFTLNLSFSGTGSLEIADITLAETSGRYKKGCFYALLLCLLLEVCYRFKKSDSSKRAVMLGLAGIFALSCYPLYTDYLTVGHDLVYHLLRIEGIAEGLATGNFPVKIYPVWAKDYGYAVGVLYGDLLLYFPAFLRLLDFSIQSAYKFYVAAVNLGTVLISYYTFRKIFDSRRIGVAGSLIYTLSYYRLIDLYTRSAAGEYSAMMFLPLVLLAFYQIFTATDKKNWWKRGIIVAFGLTGLIQTHILSCEVAAFVILLFCLILLPKVFRKYTFLALAEGALLTVAINFGFLVPFLEFYGSELVISSANQNDGPLFFQSNGLFPVQLFSIFQNSVGGSWSTKSGLYHESTFGLGILFLIMIALFCYLAACHHGDCKKHPCYKGGVLCTIIGSVLAYMSTCYFPWDAIAASGSVMKKLIGTLQFPWRVLEVATLLLTFTACFVLAMLPKLMDKAAAYVILSSSLILMAVNVGWYFYGMLYETELPYRIYNTCELSTMALYSYEYLPEDMDPEEIERDLILWEKVQGVEDYNKRGTNIQCRVIEAQAGGYIDFPLIGYDHYICVCTDTGEQLPVGTGYNHMLRVEFPTAFEGTIQISFREPWYWRLSEIVTVAVVVACVLFLCRGARKPRQKV